MDLIQTHHFVDENLPGSRVDYHSIIDPWESNE